MRLSYKSIICFQLLVSSLYWCEGCLDEERRLLLQIKDTAGYRKRMYPLGVWAGENCCEWPGVSCQTFSNSSSHVISIDLTWDRETEGLGTWYPNASLFAQFKQLENLSMSQIGGWSVEPRGLCGMRNLKRLDLSGSNLDAELIPSCLLTNSSKLEKLELVGNSLRSLDGFVQIKSLKTLFLLGNSLNESINSLSGLCGMTNLKSLYLGDNNLDDEHMPSCLLTNSSKLEELHLYYNNLRSLDGFVQIKSLRILSLNSNSLNESINSLLGLCGMRNLKSLDLSDNNLDDEHIPLCLLTNSSNLEELNLGGNNLRSLDGFAHVKSLRTLSLSYNKLNESINSLSGLCGMKKLKRLDLSHNNLDDEHIPSCLLNNSSKLEELYLTGNNLQSLVGLTYMKSLRALALGGNRLNKSINSLLGLCEMRNLKSLYLPYNNLDDGDIPPCLQQLSNLQELYLNENQLTDIGSWLSNVTSLVSLSLSFNHLKDSKTLKGLCALKNLRDVDLSDNSIEGQIPTCFKDMYALRELDLSYNLFNGSIPPFIFSNLTMIETFDIGNNQLNGVIPFFMFANCSKFSYIDISNNPQAKVETEHPHWTPTFQLIELSLTRCNVSSNIPSFLSSQRHLWHFESDYSYLNGPIPPWILYNATTPLYISLRGNMLNGPFPESSQESPSMLTGFDISENDIYGALPINIGVLLPMMVYFNASKNALQGNIPSSMGELAVLEILDLSQNKLSGEMPLGLAENNTSLKCLVLSKNYFEGQIFAKDFNASQLLTLVLHNNHFNGTIPWSLSNSPSLMFLDVRNNRLAGSIPSWLSSLPHMVSILLSGNNFIGPIPLDFYQMQNLHTLDLSNNHLSGRIPSCFNNISSLVKSSSIFEHSNGIIYDIRTRPHLIMGQHIRLTMDFNTKGSVYTYEGVPLSWMTGLDLSMNRLTGDIPPELGDLKGLHTLNLSNNHLTGLIPESFKHLGSMESLDLSHNKLIGPIPFQLAQLNFLAIFYVTFNNLSGKIPSEGQFSTFNESSYVGNLGLCGPPVERNCSSNDPLQPRDKEEHNEESDILSRPIIFYLWVVLSFALGFSSFLLILIFNANWRWKFFIIVDEYIDLTCEGIRKFLIMRKWM